MSPLPQKKKSAEELAALRESLGISTEGPPPDAPGVAKAGVAKAGVPGPGVAAEEKSEVAEELKAAVFEQPAEQEELPEQKEQPRVKAVRSLRRSERMPVDLPKKIAKNSGELPVRRHTEKELVQLKKIEAPAVEPPVMHLQMMTAGWPGLAAIYGGGLLLMGLAGLGAWAGKVSSLDLPAEWLAEVVRHPSYPMFLYGILAAGAAMMLAGAGWIRWRKPRSQHHAGFLTIIAVLVLVFGTLYFFPALHGA